MINPKKLRIVEPSDLEKEIERLFLKLADLSEDSEEYDKVSDQIKKLYPLKEIDSKRKVSPDVLVGIASNIVGITMIIKHEHVHIITSKAIGFIGRGFKS